MFSWLIDPSKSFAEGMEITFAIGLFLTTLIVVVGLVGEYRKGDWWKRNLQIFEMLVVIGVAGEMLTETGAFWYSLKTQAIAGHEIIQATQKANDAAVQAGKLGVSVDHLQAFVDQKSRQADSDVQRLQGIVDTQKRRNAAVIAELDRDKEQLEKARNDALTAAGETKKDLEKVTVLLNQANDLHAKVEKLTQPRQVSDFQKAVIETAVKQFAGQEYLIIPYWDLKESHDLANQLNDALEKSGWSYKPPERATWLMGGIEGVIVNVDSFASEKAKKAAHALATVLNANGVFCKVDESKGDPSPGKASEMIEISVGSKPQ